MVIVINIFEIIFLHIVTLDLHKYIVLRITRVIQLMQYANIILQPQSPSPTIVVKIIHDPSLRSKICENLCLQVVWRYQHRNKSVSCRLKLVDDDNDAHSTAFSWWKSSIMLAMVHN